MKFWLGLTMGVTLGAGAAYLGLTRPWRSPPEVIEVTAVAPPDAGVLPAKKSGRKGGKLRAANGGANGEAADERPLTAADRAQEWRGDAVALPPAQLDLADEQVGRSLDDGEISRVISAGSASIVACISDASPEEQLSAEVTLQMLVGGDGRVQKARVRAPAYLHRHGLLECVRGSAWSLRFPPTGAPTVVTAPFHLN